MVVSPGEGAPVRVAARKERGTSGDRPSTLNDRFVNVLKSEASLWSPPTQTVEKPLEEHERAEALSNSNRPRRRVRRGQDDYCVGKSHFQSKNRFLAVFAAGIRRIHAKTGEAGNGGGACFPVHPLVKQSF